MKKILWIIAAAIVLGLIVWLAYGYLAPKPPAAEQPAETPAETVDRVIGELDPADPISFLNIQEIIDLGADGVDPLLAKAGSEDDVAQWAVVVGLSSLREPAGNPSIIHEQMARYYDSDYLTIRLHAALSNAEFGDYSGVPMLIEALENDEIMLYMEPPQPVSVFALKALQNLSGENFSNDRETWQDWWDNSELNQ